MTPQGGKPVFIAAAARTDMLKYEPRHFRSLSHLLADPVLQLPPHLVSKVDTVYVTHRYPTPWELTFDREQFLESARLPKGDRLRVLVDSRAALGGMDVIAHALQQLRHGHRSTVLLVGGEVFSPSVVQYLRDETPGARPDADTTSPAQAPRSRFDRKERRNVLNKYGGLPASDRSVGLTPLSANALVADAFFRHWKLPLSEINDLLGYISCHLEKFAFHNSHAYQHHKQKPGAAPGMDRILLEKYVRMCKRKDKWPFTLLDLCSISNGGGALLLTNEADELVHKVEIASCVIKWDDRGLLERQRLFEFDPNIEIWRQIKAETGVSFARPNPGGRPLMILELFDIYAFQVAVTLLAMGMYEHPKEVIVDLKSGYFDPEPRGKIGGGVSADCGVALNPSGGSKDGHANGGHALVKTAECFFQLTGLHTLARFRLPVSEVSWAFVQAVSGAGNAAGVLGLRRA